MYFDMSRLKLYRCYLVPTNDRTYFTHYFLLLSMHHFQRVALTPWLI